LDVDISIVAQTLLTKRAGGTMDALELLKQESPKGEKITNISNRNRG